VDSQLLSEPVVLADQPLYPTQVIDAATAMRTYTMIPPCQVVVIPLDTMADAQMVQIKMTQAYGGEDFALRVWVSDQPLGVSKFAERQGFVALSRAPARPVVLYTASQTPPADAIRVPVINQRYYLNVQNVTNTAIAFSFLLSVLG
jgi:hypothetical protein